MKKHPLVSVIVTTYNNHETLSACLRSIKEQHYNPIELIVVDNESADDTATIAKHYTKHVFIKGPERSAQRNFGVNKSKGQYVLIIDSDMELGPDIIKACVDKVQKSPETEAVIIPEESFGVGFWAQCKKLERSFYVGIDGIEAARFYEKALYLELGGFDETLTGVEDWDLSNRAAAKTKIGRISEFILHNEGKLKLGKTLKKKHYYAGLSRIYIREHGIKSKRSNSIGPIKRYKLFSSQPKRLFSDPVLGLGMLFMKTCEFIVIGSGYYLSKPKNSYQVKGKENKKSTIFIISHSSGIEGPIDYYEAYLLRNGYEVTKLTHPLDNYRGKDSTLTVNGQCQTQWERSSNFLSLFIDFTLSVREIRGYDFEIFIGANNFDTFCALFCKNILRRKIPKVIYFASDFSEERYKNVILNKIYYSMESFVLKHADLVISNTFRAAEKRAQLGLQNSKSKVIPNGVYLEKPNFKNKSVLKHNFIFVGSVTKEHGLYNLLETIAPIVKHLVIIGQGNDLDRTINLCKRKSISYELHYKKEHDFVMDYLMGFNGIGLAPYNLDAKWTYYCSPLKVNEYIACGIPVIISSIPEIAKLIQKKKLGIVYERLDSLSLKTSIEEFDGKQFNGRAKKFYDSYNCDSLYKNITLGNVL